MPTAKRPSRDAKLLDVEQDVGAVGRARAQVGDVHATVGELRHLILRTRARVDRRVDAGTAVELVRSAAAIEDIIVPSAASSASEPPPPLSESSKLGADVGIVPVGLPATVTPASRASKICVTMSSTALKLETHVAANCPSASGATV